MLWLRGLFLLTVVSCAVSTAVLWRNLSNQSDRIEQVATLNHTNLCQVEGRILKKARREKADAQRFLKAHPNGIPGISRAEIENAVKNDDADIRAATDRTCQKGAP